jgi:hypothetical protein
MKIRNGFVSNSSSSSFILKLDKIPTSVEETIVMLYGENPPLLTTHWGDDAISTQRVSEIIFKDFNNSFLMSLNNMINNVEGEINSFNEYNYEEGISFVKGTKYENEFEQLFKKIMETEKRSNKYSDDWNWEKHYDELDELSKPMLELVKKSIREKYNENDIFINVSYSDNDGAVFSYIEHSGVLKPFIVQRFSHH